MEGEKKIRKLTDAEISKIASGEIILCPGSVVKELLENAIDAKATEITINIKNNGMKLIEVIDNGHGLSYENLLNCTKRSYTSKFTSLKSIKNFGFRGEGLYAIDQSAKLTIISKGNKFFQGKTSPCSTNKGTIVRVEDLFYKWPVRKSFANTTPYKFRKFIKSITPYVYFYQDRGIKFIIKHNGKLYDKLSCSIKSHFLLEFQHELPILNKDVYQGIGKKKSDNLQDSEKKVCCQGKIFTTLGINSMIFVNGRPIYNRTIHQLVKNSYKALTGQEHFSYIIKINCPTEYVNVNIHPEKKQVQFRGFDWRSLIKTAIAREPIKTKYYPKAQLKDSNKQKSTIFNIENSQEYLTIDQNLIEEQPLSVSQISLRYLLFTYRDYFILMDQHAAHERIIAERIKKEKINLTQLLVPKVIIDYKNQPLDHLKDIIKYERVNNTIIITAIAEFLTDKQLEDLIYSKNHKNNYIFDFIHDYGCKKSIRTGYEFNEREAKDLLMEVKKCKNGHMCNHGRPTYMKFDKKHLDKLFWRTGGPCC